ncbi:MAG: aldehyde ferredoxin oxidoreductase family protein [Euryarchaeota archaeon]|nr:aldehyde ferredoxin oxidoreductase family protein [Euryarchaeota archaeon]
MKNGYMRKILSVDLSEKRANTEPINEEVAKKYIGGKGYALYLLHQILKEKKDIDALGEENPLIFATGPGTGVVGFPSPGRYHVMAAKAPLTGSIGSGDSGGSWGPSLKFAGFDAIVVKGSSEEPVYLDVADGKAELKDASGLWGKDTFDTCRTLKKGKNASVACIGPAGENKVLMSCIMNDEHRAVGRVGLGAVMGSKNLKAIVVSGNNKVEVAKPEEFKKISKNCLKRIKENAVTGEGLPAYGTASLVNIINEVGALPFKNWQTGYNEEADKISGETMSKEYLIKKNACWGCTIACGRVTKVEKGPYQIEHSEGPEYESVWALGNDTGVMDLGAVIKANDLCDKLGLDTITMGSTIACAMELNEKGHIDEGELQGVDLRFGNAAAMVELVEKTAYKKGFGAYLALGSKRLAEKFGAPELSMSVKGLEMPAYDPRAVKGIGLNYATSNRGGCHVTGYTIAPEVVGIPEKIDPLVTEGKAQWVKVFQDLTCVVNSTVNCLFTTFAMGAGDYAELLSAVTGWDFSEEEIMKIGERIYNLERVIINKYGFDGKDDTLPKRLLEEEMPEGAAKGHTADLDKMKEEYYELRGWKNGKPTEEKLEELGIEL